MTTAVRIEAVCTGRIAAYGPNDEPSAIAKVPVAGQVAVHLLGLEGDAQADLSVHGGRDKAIHHYPRDHYAWWTAHLGDLPELAGPGGFGENISTCGLSEHDVCIGDRFRLGPHWLRLRRGGSRAGSRRIGCAAPVSSRP